MVPSRQGAGEVFHTGPTTSALLSTGGMDQPAPATHPASEDICIFLEITESGMNVVGGCSETLVALEQILTINSCLEKIENIVKR